MHGVCIYIPFPPPPPRRTFYRVDNLNGKRDGTVIRTGGRALVVGGEYGTPRGISVSARDKKNR